MSIFLFQHPSILKVASQGGPRWQPSHPYARRHLNEGRKGKMLGLLGELLKGALVSPIQLIGSYSADLPTVTDAGKQCLLSE